MELGSKGSYNERKVKEWDVNDVCDWLKHTVGLTSERYQQIFKLNEISGSVLLILTGSELKEMGIETMGHRKRIEIAIQELVSWKDEKKVSSHEYHDTKSGIHNDSISSNFAGNNMKKRLRDDNDEVEQMSKDCHDCETKRQRTGTDSYLIQKASSSTENANTNTDRQINEGKHSSQGGDDEEKSTQTKGKDPLSDKISTCPICFEDYEFKDSMMHTLSNCSHEFCRDCIRHYLMSRIESKQIPIMCPDRECKKEIDLQDLSLVLNQIELDKFERIALESIVDGKSNSKGKNANALNGTSRIDGSGSSSSNDNQDSTFCYCPTPDCGYIFLHVKPPISLYENGDDDDYHFRCEKCKKHYCLRCKCNYHFGMSCIGYKKKNLDSRKDDLLFLRFVSQHNIKQCPNCNRFVEKAAGCNHIYCMCGTEFCYYCSKKSSTCVCGRNPHVMNKEAMQRMTKLGPELFQEEEEDDNDEM